MTFWKNFLERSGFIKNMWRDITFLQLDVTFFKLVTESDQNLLFSGHISISDILQEQLKAFQKSHKMLLSTIWMKISLIWAKKHFLGFLRFLVILKLKKRCSWLKTAVVDNSYYCFSHFIKITKKNYFDSFKQRQKPLFEKWKIGWC